MLSSGICARCIKELSMVVEFGAVLMKRNARRHSSGDKISTPRYLKPLFL